MFLLGRPLNDNRCTLLCPSTPQVSFESFRSFSDFQQRFLCFDAFLVEGSLVFFLLNPPPLSTWLYSNPFTLNNLSDRTHAENFSIPKRFSLIQSIVSNTVVSQIHFKILPLHARPTHLLIFLLDFLCYRLTRLANKNPDPLIIPQLSFQLSLLQTRIQESGRAPPQKKNYTL